MCIICISGKDAPLPAYQTLCLMMDNNPDGSGFMVPHTEGKRVLISKGFKKPRSLLRALAYTVAELGFSHAEDVPIVIHSRIGTTGDKINPTHCHPFPITSSTKALKAHVASAEMGMAHNGTFLGCGTDTDLSDSMLMIKNYLADYNWAELVKARNLLALVFRQSRVTILNHSGRLLWWGDWDEDKDTGLTYSNLSYLESYGRYTVTQCNGPWGYNNYTDSERKHVRGIRIGAYGRCSCCGFYSVPYARVTTLTKVCRECYDAYYRKIGDDNPEIKIVDIEPPKDLAVT